MRRSKSPNSTPDTTTSAAAKEKVIEGPERLLLAKERFDVPAAAKHAENHHVFVLNAVKG